MATRDQWNVFRHLTGHSPAAAKHRAQLQVLRVTSMARYIRPLLIRPQLPAMPKYKQTAMAQDIVVYGFAVDWHTSK